jgi:hypothetical protein
MKLEKARKQARKIGGKLVEKPSQLENKQKNKDERLHLEEICFVLFGCFNQSIKGKWKLVDGRIGNWFLMEEWKILGLKGLKIRGSW